jgi:serine/threonine-protein kinase
MIGRGGMGAVFQATHLEIGTRVAIKLLLDLAGDSADAKTRFLNEARLTGRLTSEHVVRVTDAGMHAGAPFIVMEFLEGEDLARTLRREKVLRMRDAADAIVEACHALHDAHSQGMVHRDIKPPNIFVARAKDGHRTVKLLDFGICKAPDSGKRITSEQSFMGSPQYAAPEQLQSTRDADARSDIWSLGATLFELLCGKRAFQGDTFGETISKVLKAKLPRPEDHIVGCPPEVASLISACLQRDVEKRIQSVTAVARALAPFGSARSQVIASRLGDANLAATRVSVKSHSGEEEEDATSLDAIPAFGAAPGLGALIDEAITAPPATAPAATAPAVTSPEMEAPAFPPPETTPLGTAPAAAMPAPAAAMPALAPAAAGEPAAHPGATQQLPREWSQGAHAPPRVHIPSSPSLSLRDLSPGVMTPPAKSAPSSTGVMRAVLLAAGTFVAVGGVVTVIGLKVVSGPASTKAPPAAPALPSASGATSAVADTPTETPPGADSAPQPVLEAVPPPTSHAESATNAPSASSSAAPAQSAAGAPARPPPWRPPPAAKPPARPPPHGTGKSSLAKDPDSW